MRRIAIVRCIPLFLSVPSHCLSPHLPRSFSTPHWSYRRRSVCCILTSKRPICQFASASGDKTVRLWEKEAVEDRLTIADVVMSATYLPPEVGTNQRDFGTQHPVNVEGWSKETFSSSAGAMVLLSSSILVVTDTIIFTTATAIKTVCSAASFSVQLPPKHSRKLRDSWLPLSR